MEGPEPENVLHWKNNDFVQYCQNSNKYKNLADFMKSNSIDGTFFFTITADDFSNVNNEEIDKNGIDLFFELQKELANFAKNEEEELILEPNQEMSQMVLHIEEKANGKINPHEFNQPEIKIGRDQNCNLQYQNDKSISRSHATLTKVGPYFFARDESSSNGTFLKLQHNNTYGVFTNMNLELHNFADLEITHVGLLQIKIRVLNEKDEESQKEFVLNLWGQQSWIIGMVNDSLTCDISDNFNVFQRHFFEIKQVGIKNVLKVLNEDGIWAKIGSKELKDICKFYPLKKNDVLKIGDNIELTINEQSIFENFNDTCTICKVPYPESLEFINLDCKHCVLCRACRRVEVFCPVCNQPMNKFETISNIVLLEEP